ncbi:MAG: heparan-alpha-glucosaminide N-acetyltransferase domain-containing protein [Polaribacter sp.]
MKKRRLYFIDLVRAFAILMMLQGHFIDALIDPVFRNSDYLIYKIWVYFRGITAPTFFTISGLIFTYLLFRAKERNQDKIRLTKGIRRGISLIAIGYLLRIPFLAWLNGYFNTYFLAIDVLQIIGISLIFIVALYCLCFKKTKLFLIASLSISIFIFITEPIYRNLNIEWLPLPINNYFSKNNGSVFTIFPWLGYVSFGAFLATIFHLYESKKKFKKTIVFSFVSLGLLLILYSSNTLVFLSKLFEIEIFMAVANYNYLFTRLGNVLLYFALFYCLEKYLKNELILKIGQNTLSIYIIHFILIYGSFTGIGFKHFFGKRLEPTEVIIGAVFFLILVCFISFQYNKNKQLFFLTFRSRFKKHKN